MPKKKQKAVDVELVRRDRWSMFIKFPGKLINVEVDISLDAQLYEVKNEANSVLKLLGWRRCELWIEEAAHCFVTKITRNWV